VAVDASASAAASEALPSSLPQAASAPTAVAAPAAAMRLRRLRGRGLAVLMGRLSDETRRRISYQSDYSD
jgi:predicted flap endonuclease-1-like 5' DNA nuclease